MAKAKLYDRPRYAFDEEQLFSHSHDKTEETKKFPWWKPVWLDGSWQMKNPDGKLFDYSLFPYGDTLRNITKNRIAAEKYAFMPIFFVEWMKQTAYYQGLECWYTHEHIFKLEFPNKKPDQIAKMCDEEVSKFFERMKG